MPIKSLVQLSVVVAFCLSLTQTAQAQTTSRRLQSKNTASAADAIRSKLSIARPLDQIKPKRVIATPASQLSSPIIKRPIDQLQQKKRSLSGPPTVKRPLDQLKRTRTPVVKRPIDQLPKVHQHASRTGKREHTINNTHFNTVNSSRRQPLTLPKKTITSKPVAASSPAPRIVFKSQAKPTQPTPKTITNSALTPRSPMQLASHRSSRSTKRVTAIPSSPKQPLAKISVDDSKKSPIEIKNRFVRRSPQQPVTAKIEPAPAINNIRTAMLPSRTTIAVQSPAQPTLTQKPVPKKVNLSTTKFADVTGFLKDDTLKFANPNKFLSKPSAKTKLAGSRRMMNRSRRQDVEPKLDGPASSQPRSQKRPSSLPTRMTFDDKNDQRYMTVADVNTPLGMNPFADLQQNDPQGLIAPSTNPFSYVMGTTYSELTGQPFQPHLASWSAHRFNHLPLYFEEVNVERYGNKLNRQELVSAAQFFATAALLPYKMAQTPPGTCTSTLGHERPGDCVPYWPHRNPISKKGLFVQGLVITALSL